MAQPPASTAPLPIPNAIATTTGFLNIPSVASQITNPSTNSIYVTNQGDGNVSVINGETNAEILPRIPVGNQPYGVATNPDTNTIYVANRLDGNVSVIDGETNAEILPRIPVGSQPCGVAVNPTTNRIYVANQASNNVSVINGATNTEIDIDDDPSNGMTRIGVRTSPEGIAVNPSTNRIYAAGGNSVSVVDGTTNSEVATVQGIYAARFVGVNPALNRVYVTDNSSHRVTVIQDFPIPAFVGGIAELPSVEPDAAAATEGGSSAPGPPALAGLAAAGTLLLSGGVWYARRRRLR